ncbi:hypothetical protein BC827DRAFT_711627 [Russula dissimulans]|nr:hypothetical protein BC827DRAFT_711627 [Russula dissimulans]
MADLRIFPLFWAVSFLNWVMNSWLYLNCVYSYHRSVVKQQHIHDTWHQLSARQCPRLSTLSQVQKHMMLRCALIPRQRLN